MRLSLQGMLLKHFAQAACNAANALRVIAEIERQKTETQPR